MSALPLSAAHAQAHVMPLPSHRLWLRRSVVLWFSIAATGLALFALYIAVSYGRSLLGGPPGESAWKAGDTLGNGQLGLHLLAAFLLSGLGVMQVLPALRRRAPALHRTLGRVFMVSALAASLSGFYLVWVRGTVGDASLHLAISLNGLLILGFALMAWREARARRFDAHRRWALRLLFAVCGVWFFRIGFMLWMLIWRAPVGFDPNTFTGPFVTGWTLGQYLLPLAFLEAYFRAPSWRPGAVHALSAAIFLASLATAAGIAGAWMGMWLPRL